MISGRQAHESKITLKAASIQVLAIYYGLTWMHRQDSHAHPYQAAYNPI
jgi:hypothetical protein